MKKIKKILIVGCRFDENRTGGARPWRVPQAMAPIYLAGAFNAELCEIKVYSELYSGPLEDRNLLSWQDMLVLTGLQVDFDRFLHLTAYARTLNTRVIVAAGGSLVEVLPDFSKQFFDYCCTGPVEDIREVIMDAFGKEYVSEVMKPRHDLAYWNKIVGYAESSRYCNFKCTFCSLAIHNRPYQVFDADRVCEEIRQTRFKTIFFLDNNFYGNNFHEFEKKVEALTAMKNRGELRTWAAEISFDFLHKPGNLTLVKNSGCSALFCGVESFDNACLAAYNKHQNMITDQIKRIEQCLKAGILFLYGLIFDPTRRSIQSIQSEFEYIIKHVEIPLPSYFTLPIPLVGTPLFFEKLENGEILPNTKIRDLDAYTLTLRPVDDLKRFSSFWSDFVRLKNYKRAVIRHEVDFLRYYKHSLNRWQMLLSAGNLLVFCLPKYRNRHRTFISTTEILDPQYKPAFRIHSKFRDYFRPVMLTDSCGRLNPQLEEVFRFNNSFKVTDSC